MVCQVDGMGAIMNRKVPIRSGQPVCRALLVIVAGLFALMPLGVSAGQIYGQITENGRSVQKDVPVKIACGSAPPITARTDRFGSYQIFVRSTGRCQITIMLGDAGLTQRVVSYANPTRYNFDIVGRGNQRRLIRR